MRTWFEKLREQFKLKGLTYADAAVHCGVATSTVGAWMIGTNEPPLSVIAKLADLAGVTLPALLLDEPYFAASRDEQELLDAYRKATPQERAAALVVFRSMTKVTQVRAS